MRTRAARSIFATLFVLAGLARAESLSFYERWRGEQTRRLAQYFPCASPSLKSRSGVSIQDVAKILGTSSAFASLCLNKPRYQFRLAHIQTLAAYLQIDPGYLLVEDRFDRFATMGELEIATKHERPMVRELLMQIFMGRAAMQTVTAANTDRPFERRRRATIKYRLARLMPGETGPAVSTRLLARTLGCSQSTAEHVVAGDTTLTYEDAVVIGREFGVAPEWILAADLLDSFNRPELVDAVTREAPAVQALLLGLWAARRSCREDLIPHEPRRSAGLVPGLLSKID